MTKKKLNETLKEISQMDKQGLVSFAQKLYLAEIEAEPFKTIESALDVRMAELMEIISPMCEVSEIKIGDLA